MYTQINSPISMIGVYQHGRFIPRKFLWQSKEYLVNQITFIHDLKNGGRKQRIYSIEAAGTIYRILFDRDDEQWTLQELWVDG